MAKKNVQIPEKSFSVVSLGCPKNLIDSETMLGRLEQAGYHFIDNPERCEFVLLNTCGFLESARVEARETISRLIALKMRQQIRHIVVAGCAVRFLGKSLQKEFPGVDAWIGVFDEEKIVEAVNSFSEKPQLLFNSKERLVLDDSLRHQLTASHVAYLKIADGCNRCCSYCAIPSIRGRFISKSREKILDEAKRLAENGVRELVLIAQETTLWGTDLEGNQPQLAGLLQSLRGIGGFEWIRVMYAYPMNFTDELISMFGSSENGCKILPYIDLPLQHCNDGILTRMNRRVMKAETEDLLGKLRERIDSLAIRTSLIVGFPGESDAIFEELLEFVDKWKFDRVGAFAFSPEPGTAAEKLDGRVSPITVNWRYRKLYERLDKIARERALAQKGKILDLMIDRGETDENGAAIENLYVGRTWADSPDNDPIVFVTSETPIAGKLVRCEIVATSGIDLVAVPTE